MAELKLFKSYRFNSFTLIFTMVLTSFLVIGGCNGNSIIDDEGEFGGIRPPMGPCMMTSPPCQTINMLQNGSVAQCVLSQTAACAVDLTDVTSQVGAQANKQIDETTILWIEAWGGKGGDTDRAADGGTGGYAVTTTTVGDIASNNNMSTTIFYFVGGAGANGPDHCGSGGGGGTIVTLEDLSTLAPNVMPTTGFPPNGPNLLVAGGGGGGCGGNGEDGICQTGGGNCDENGGNGGTAIATTAQNALGAGQTDPTPEGDCGTTNVACGGNNGVGGDLQGILEGNNTNGMDGIGGLGGAGGSGQSCDTGPDGGPVGGEFINTGASIVFLEGSGAGGSGSSNTEMCDSGGGGGGGGYGGGGGGGHGDAGASSASGGGGGSVAAASTQSSGLSPTEIQDNPCGGSAGCVSISFVLP